MEIEYDPAKNEENIRARGLPFSLVGDMRQGYGETRLIATGYIQGRVCVACFVPLSVGVIRVISLRKANPREVSRYEQAID